MKMTPIQRLRALVAARVTRYLTHRPRPGDDVAPAELRAARLAIDDYRTDGKRWR